MNFKELLKLADNGKDIKVTICNLIAFLVECNYNDINIVNDITVPSSTIYATTDGESNSVILSSYSICTKSRIVTYEPSKKYPIK